MKFDWSGLCSKDLDPEREIADNSQHLENCSNEEICSEIRRLIQALKESNGENKSKRAEELLKYLSKKQVSLQTKICFTRTVKTIFKKKAKPQNSVLKALLTLPEGCDLIKKHLDSLVIAEEDNAVIGVKLGTKTLFDPEDENSKYEQTTVLQEILSARNKMPVGRSYNALTALLRHPVMVVFILEKWDKIRDAFFFHLR